VEAHENNKRKKLRGIMPIDLFTLLLMASIKKGGERNSFVFYFLVIPPANNIYREALMERVFYLLLASCHIFLFLSYL
jgi:hypothetical protein